MKEEPKKLNVEGDEWYDPQPDDFLPNAKKPLPKIYKLPKKTSMIYVLVFLVLSLMVSYDHWMANGNDLSISYFSFFESREYWRSLSALLVHSDLGHFMNNAWMVFLFGWFLNDFSGTRAFPWISLFIGAVTNAITVFSMPMYTRLVGASGMLYGMVALWIVIYLKHTPLSIKQKLVRSLGFTLMLLFPTTYSPTTSYMAHGVGFAVGLVAGILFVLSPLDQSKPSGQSDLPEKQGLTVFGSKIG